MARSEQVATKWKVRGRRRGVEWTGELEAYWELHLDPISDDYTPQEISAQKLFDLWAGRVGKEFPSGLVPIYWSVESTSQGKFEAAPFQYIHNAELQAESFLEHYAWPINSMTGKPLNWHTLPVVDKLWRAGNATKGGFIQELTGWKPSMLQPFAYLPALISARAPA